MNVKDIFNNAKPVNMREDAREALENAAFSRRDMIKGMGALVVGFSSVATVSKLGADELLPSPVYDLLQVDSWIAIAQDESIVAYSGKTDFGQGFRTVQYQLVADELYVPLERINLIFCDTALCPDQGTTSGSQSHLTEFGPTGLRQALATARETLMAMAAKQFNTTSDQLTVKSGVISLKSDATKKVSYGQLIGGKKFNLATNAKATPKDPKDYTVLGTSVPRYDIPQKTTGEYLYVQHMRLPGMLHGKVVRPPFIDAKLISVNMASVSKLPGNVKVVTKKNWVAVVADTEWYALQAASALDVTWTDTPALPSQDTFYDSMRKRPSRDSFTVNTGDVDATMKTAKTVLKSTYFYPYQMHGSVGSSCAVADVYTLGGTTFAKIWSPTQGVYPQRDSVAQVLGTAKENVRVMYVEGSGCYGLNGADSVSYDAALMSQMVGKPVRVQYSRADEMTGGEHYGASYVIDLTGGLDAQGRILAWDYEGWSTTRGNRPTAAAPGNVITGYLVGFPLAGIVPAAAAQPTTFGNNSNTASNYGSGCVATSCGSTGTVRSERVLNHSVDSPFFTGPLRSPARLQNTFANESFMDELAASAKLDPIDFRLRHLADTRLIDAVNAAAKAANWQTRPSPKPGNAKTGTVTGRGFACVLYEGTNGYSAMVAEVTVNQDTGDVVVNRLVMAEDSGPVSNPDGLRNQMEGGALQGMSRALKEEVKWNDSVISSTQWRRYPVQQFGQPMPELVSVLINRLDKPQLGAGECTITLSAAAIGNAVYDATGARLRQVPFTPVNVMAALKARG
jgi:nicotinate dehydrogenase subunit B